MIRARSWNVSLRSAGPPTSRAWRSIPPKSSPPEPVRATGEPSMALAISARLPSPGDPLIEGVIEQLESLHRASLRRSRTLAAPEMKQRRAMIEPVRPISLGDIEAARRQYRRHRAAGRRWSGSNLAALLRKSGSSWKICSRPMPTRSAARPMRSRDCRTKSGLAACGRSAPAMPDKAWPMPRARPELPARSWRSKRHRKPSSTGCGRSARPSSRFPTSKPGRLPKPMSSTGSRAPSSTRSTIMISLPVMAPWAWRSSRICRRFERSSRQSAAAD